MGRVAVFFVVVVAWLCVSVSGLPRLRQQRRRRKSWSKASRRVAQRIDASVFEVVDLLLSLQDARSRAGARFGGLGANCLAGLASAVAVVPEASQFALIAGAHPLVGLGSTLVVGSATAVFGGRPGMITGASATCALVLRPLVAAHGVEAMRVAVALAGALQLLVGLLKGGRLIRMVPQPVVLGFVNGLAVKVLRAQVDHFQHPQGVWLRGAALRCHAFLAVASFVVIEAAPAAVTRYAPAP